MARICVFSMAVLLLAAMSFGVAHAQALPQPRKPLVRSAPATPAKPQPTPGPGPGQTGPGVAGTARPGGGEDMAIGFIGNFSGADSDVSRDRLDGFKLLIKHLTGRLGGMEFVLNVANDHGLPATGADAAKNVLAKGHVRFLLLASPSDAAKDILAAAEASHTFLIALDNVPADLAGPSCNNHLFSLAPPPNFLDRMAGDFFHKQGYRNPMLILPDTENARNAAAAFDTGFGTPAKRMTIKRGEMRFRAEITTLRGQPPDAAPSAAYVLLGDGMEASFIRQTVAAGLNKRIPLYGPSTTFDRTRIDALGPAAAGFFSFGAWSEDMDSDANKVFVADFQSEYNRIPSIAASEGYDAALLLDEALKQAGAKWNQDEALLSALRHAEIASVNSIAQGGAQGGLHFGFNQFPVQNYVLRQAADSGQVRLGNPQRAVIAKDLADDLVRQCSMRWGPEPQAKPPVKH